MPRPRSLNPIQIASAALAVIDEGGLSALTMRGVAKELNATAMCLYRYVADRDELEALVVEQALAGVDTTAPVEGDWRDRVAVLVRRMRVVIGCHPAVVPLLPVHRHRSPTVLRWTESLLAVLTEAGLDGTRRAVALRALLAYTVGAIQQEHLAPLSGGGTTAMAALSPAEFPHLAATAADAGRVDPDAEFDGGLEILLRGLTTD
ncbi:TetR/AcrR family transcriptional regulator C-terminal domain-containing protein [Micromonospora coxensis]|uniref:Transcriptional regulator, TetR family n=1 Tax=Micromonospora coxensis TaxID=356852 RepID=A0A1C5IHE0_9ACTN|nr:TetR/AcrR family transcriptional regulator C-terminal domain-containing protein [Micromonospora coxensis]SCG57780.1 transcriptional regulator, TetR family [Micromonospora coxensis]